MFGLRQKGGSGYEYMVVGLGNPGKQYEKTRHNTGFMAVDAFCEKYSATPFKSKFNALICDCKVNGKKVLAVKPQTFMNNSGEAVARLARYYKIPNEKIIVLFDDISFNVGIMRIRRKGSSGGHNGIKSIIAHLNGEDFLRIKIGVGSKPHEDADLANHVLANFSSSDLKELKYCINNAVCACELIIDNQTDKAMNKYNG